MGLIGVGWTALTLKYRIIGIVALIALLALSFRWYTNSLYEKGVAAGKAKGIEESAEIYNQIALKKAAEFKLAQEKLQQQASELAQENEAIEAARRRLVSDYTKSIAIIRRRGETKNVEIAKIPASQLDASIKQLLADIRKPNIN